MHGGWGRASGGRGRVEGRARGRVLALGAAGGRRRPHRTKTSGEELLAVLKDATAAEKFGDGGRDARVVKVRTELGGDRLDGHNVDPYAKERVTRLVRGEGQREVMLHAVAELDGRGRRRGVAALRVQYLDVSKVDHSLWLCPLRAWEEPDEPWWHERHNPRRHTPL